MGAFDALQFTVYTVATTYGGLVEVCRILHEKAEGQYKVRSDVGRVKLI